MKKKLEPLSLHRETLRHLTAGALSIAVAETGSHPHSACATCTLVDCPQQTA